MKVEIETFSEKIKDFVAGYKVNKKNKKSTQSFWLENKNLMPIFYKTATILLNISASSAFIERFFSFCGVVCDSRRECQSDETIICRCMLKASMEILKKLNQKYELNRE